MSRIVAILLTIHSSRGHQLCFAYPRDPVIADAGTSQSPDNPLGSEYLIEVNQTRSTAATPTTTDPNKNPQSSPQSPPSTPSPHQSPHAYLNLPTNILADILSPKANLCDKKFLLSVDKITFLGHPTLLSGDKAGTEFRYLTRMRQRKEESRCASEKASLDNLQTKPGKEATETSSSKLTSFNVVFALFNDGEREIEEEVDAIHNGILVKLVTALKYEQSRRDFIRNEARLMIKIREEAGQSSKKGKL